MPNRLANETSPYLLQHKENPVDWFAWSEDALAEARAKDKPILLSVGYSACHWCHVMAHESFENEEIAGLMNDLFVNIKVDREERPDIDGIYMHAVQAMTGRGGWPMTVFLTPEGMPFYGGTYYPPEDRQGMPGFPRVLSAVASAYRGKRRELEDTAKQIQDQLAMAAGVKPGADLLAEDILNQAYAKLAQGYDAVNGGFGPAPKFPQAMVLDFLLRYHHRTGRPAPLAIVERTLLKMAQGGMYDQIGGGFHRYSTDAVWLVPHFEKMLYDNALLARLYLDAYRVTDKPFYRQIVEQTLDYVLREMTDASGGFYSTQDADSEGEEGKFFVWTPTEMKPILGGHAALLLEYFGVSDAGNFEGRNILHVPIEEEEFARQKDMPAEQLAAVIARAREKLYEAREQRVHPGRDEKILTAWNGMMMRAFAEAGLALDSERYRAAAARNADFLLAELRRGERLLRTWKGGVAKLSGYLEDYALLIDGLLAVNAATLDIKYLQSAIQLTDEMIDLFWDESVQGFYDTGADHEVLIARPRDFFDNATPSGSAVATDVLLRLAVITGNAEYERKGTLSLRAVAPFIERAPTGFGRHLAALDFHLSRPVELALVQPGSDGVKSDPLSAAAFAAYLPHLVAVGGPEGAGAELTPLLRDRPVIDGELTAYVCEGYVCQAPTTDPEALQSQLASASG